MAKLLFQPKSNFSFRPSSVRFLLRFRLGVPAFRRFFRQAAVRFKLWLTTQLSGVARSIPRTCWRPAARQLRFKCDFSAARRIRDPRWLAPESPIFVRRCASPGVPGSMILSFASAAGDGFASKLRRFVSIWSVSDLGCFPPLGW